MSSQADHQVNEAIIEEVLRWARSTLETNDSVAKILRLHALTEHYLDRTLTLHLVDAKLILSDGRFTYHHKRLLVGALGVFPIRVLDSLKRLSSLRNKCAHSAFPSISAADVLHAAEPIQKSFDNTRTDCLNDGLQIDEFQTYAWALFTEISLTVKPLEMFVAQATNPSK